jgi:hypothetical protein
LKHKFQKKYKEGINKQMKIKRRRRKEQKKIHYQLGLKDEIENKKL